MAKVDRLLQLERDFPRGLKRGARGVRAEWQDASEMTAIGVRDWQESDNALLPRAIMLGRRFEDGRVMGWVDDKHVLLVAGSRAGKGVSIINPNLLSYAGSCLVIDPKGELAAVTRRRRLEMGQAVHVLDPFGASKLPEDARASFNPLAEIDLTSDDAVDDAAMCAEALIIPPEQGERHWSESAQQVLQAIILMVLNDPEPARRNLVTVRDLLRGQDDLIKRVMTEFKIGVRTPLQALLLLLRQQVKTGDALPPETTEADLQKRFKAAAKGDVPAPIFVENENPHGAICAGVAEWLDTLGDNERGSILSSSLTQTRWLDSPAMRRTLQGDGFSLRALKTAPKGATIYLCLPATRMAVYHRWLRLIISLGLTVMEREDTETALPVLFVLDEFPVLGHMQSIESAAGQMAGFGVKLLCVIQNVGQLVKHYGNTGFQTFVGNAGLVLAFGNSDNETLKELSEMLGRTEYIDKRVGDVSPQASRQYSPVMSEERREQALMAPHEVRLAFARGRNRCLVWTAEKSPAFVERFHYYAESGPDAAMFAGLYDDPPKRGVKR